MTAVRQRASRRAMAATGGLGGLFSGLTGVGGGAMMVPLMTGVLKMRQHAAHGTSLVVIVFAAAAGAATYIVHDGVDWLLVGMLLAGSIAGAYSGARLVQLLPAMRLRQCFGLFLLAVGMRLVLFHNVEPLLATSGASHWAAAMGIGLAGGLSAGALGVGGGAIFVPGLVILLGTGQHQAQAASLDVIIVTACVGAATHYQHGSVDLGTARWLVPAAVPAGIGGALLASALDATVLQAIFAVVVLGVGAQMFLTATRSLRQGVALTTPTIEASEA